MREPFYWHWTLADDRDMRAAVCHLPHEVNSQPFRGHPAGTLVCRHVGGFRRQDGRWTMRATIVRVPEGRNLTGTVDYATIIPDEATEEATEVEWGGLSRE